MQQSTANPHTHTLSPRGTQACLDRCGGSIPPLSPACSSRRWRRLNKFLGGGWRLVDVVSVLLPVGAAVFHPTYPRCLYDIPVLVQPPSPTPTRTMACACATTNAPFNAGFLFFSRLVHHLLCLWLSFLFPFSSHPLLILIISYFFFLLIFLSSSSPFRA